MPTPITGIPTPTYSPTTWADLATMAAALEALGVPPFTSTATRDAAIPYPATGQCCTVAGVLYVHNGAAWALVSGGGGSSLTQTNATCTYATGYAAYSASYAPLSVVRTGTLVTLEGGLVSVPSASYAGGTYYTVATIPIGYRPSGTHRVATMALYTSTGIVTTQCRVNTSGALEFAPGAGTSPSGVNYIIPPGGLSWQSA